MPKLWFTADTHFGHLNIMKYCHRPFHSVEEMDETMIRNINDLVHEDDILYHLGDFSFGSTLIWRNRIKCKQIILIRGNHDKQIVPYCFSSIHDLLQVKVQYNRDSQKIILCHYAMRIWNASHHGSWHLYGHSHSTLTEDVRSLSFDVGVDGNNFSPLNINQIAGRMSRKIYLEKN